jgi:hypothetical protein
VTARVQMTFFTTAKEDELALTSNELARLRIRCGRAWLERLRCERETLNSWRKSVAREDLYFVSQSMGQRSRTPFSTLPLCIAWVRDAKGTAARTQRAFFTSENGLARKGKILNSLQESLAREHADDIVKP